jgi:hypothetical protein
MPLAALLLLLQLPANEKLSPEDSKEFQAEINRIEQLQKSANDKCTALYGGPTTGTIAGNAFYFLGNTNGDPIRILRLTLLGTVREIMKYPHRL